MVATFRTDNKCGTEAGYQRHYRKKEPACDACKKAHSEATMRKRRSIPKAPMDPTKCGTDAGYQQHRRRREEACERCLTAHNELVVTRKRRSEAIRRKRLAAEAAIEEAKRQEVVRRDVQRRAVQRLVRLRRRDFLLLMEAEYANARDRGDLPPLSKNHDRPFGLPKEMSL